MQNFDHPSCKVLITGTSGTGKTTLFEKLVRKEKARLKFVYDHQGEFSHRFDIPAITDPEEMLEKTSKGGWVVFDPIKSFPGKSQAGFDFFCEYVFSIAPTVPGRKLFCCDELQKLTDTSTEPEKFLVLCETGRRFEIDIFCIGQAPNRIHNAIRNQLTEIYTFRQSDKNALNYLTDNGFDPEKIRNLTAEKHEWIGRNLDSGEITASSPEILADTTGNPSASDSGQR